MKQKFTSGLNEMCDRVGMMAVIVYVMWLVLPNWLTFDENFAYLAGLFIVLSFVKGFFQKERATK